GTVLLACRPRGRRVQIEVRDSGIGIPRDKQSEIFQEFYQLDNPARDRRRGLGLGLAIVARVAKLLDTTVDVRPEPGRGSLLFLQLPRADDVPLALRDERALTNLSDASIAHTNVLVVDDDALVLSANRALLQSMGCRVMQVSDGASAAEALRSSHGQ